MIPDSVTCDITGVTHLVVTSNQHVAEFINWTNRIVQEMNSGKTRFISIDCEGFNLGAVPNSLHLVQLAECYDEHIFDRDLKTPVSLNLKPGFMVYYPTTPEVTQALSSVLSHNNVKLITFDFVNDFAPMMEAGIKLNPLNAFDCKAFGSRGGYNTVKSLKEVCESGDLCAEFGRCIQAIRSKNSIPFSKLTYESRNDRNPFDRFLTQEFWKYASHDIALTALAGIACITKYNKDDVIQFSQNEARKMMEDQAKYGVIAPSIARQNAFLVHVVPNIKNTRNAKFAYNNFSKAYCAVLGWDYMDPISKASLQRDKQYFVEAMNNADRFIRTHPNEMRFVF